MTFREKLKKETVLLDGAFGTYIQSLGLKDGDFKDKPGCMEYLSITRPDLIKKVHADYFEAGSDAVETDSFGGNAIKLAEYGLEKKVFEINKLSASLAKEEAERFSSPSWKRYVVGTMGPTGKLPSSTDPSLGNISYGELKDVFFEQARGLIAGGADAILVETAQDLLEIKAAVNGARKAIASSKNDIVLMAEFTLSNNGRMLLGTDVSAVVATLSYLGVDVIGMNCSSGPLEMETAVKYLSGNAPMFISCLPNAGLPVEKNGKTVYPLGPEEMARIMSRFVKKYGIDIIGGCCGTDPRHIRAMRESLKTPKKRKLKRKRFFASSYKGQDIDDIKRPVVAGERINTQGSRKMKELLLGENYEEIVELGKEQEKKGAHLLDVCGVLTERPTEKRDDVILVRKLAESVEVPLMIDSTDAEVIEAALSSYPGTMFINSVNLEDGGKKARRIFPLAKEFGAFTIALVIDEKGMAKTAAKKVSIAKKIYSLAVKGHGLRPGQLVFDMLTFTLGTGEKEYARSAMNTFGAIKAAKKKIPGVLTVLGVSNVSFGLPKEARPVLNAVYLHYAVKAGLDMAIINPAAHLLYRDIPKKERDLAEDLIFARDKKALEKIVDYFAAKKSVEMAADIEGKALSLEERVKKCVMDRNKAAIVPLLDEALKSMKAEDIINKVLLEAMREVGEKLDSGEFVLPYVLQAAEVMKKALDHLKGYLPHESAGSRGKILLATVFGDVHDIGKNLVRMILENNGFAVIDLGKQVPVERILAEAKEHKVDAIGLSALLVSTARYMKTCIEAMHEAGLRYPVMIGGAPVNQEFAKNASVLKDGSIYKSGVFYAKDAFMGLKIIRALTDPEGKARLMKDYQEQFAKDEARAAKNEKRKTDHGPEVSKNDIRHTIYDIRKTPVPPFYGTRTLVNISADEVFGRIDERAIYSAALGTKFKDAAKKEELIEKEYKPLLRGLKEEALRKGWLELKAVYGYFKCRVSGQGMEIFAEDGKVLETFYFATEPGAALTDYFTDTDIVAFQAVTAGDKVNDVIRKMREDGDYARSFLLHSLSVHLTEALAAYAHDRIRKELGLGAGQGKRYSPGYPLWKDISDQKKIFSLLDVEKRIGVRLTEACQMVPEQSTTAMIVHNERAKY